MPFSIINSINYHFKWEFFDKIFSYHSLEGPNMALLNAWRDASFLDGSFL